MEISMHEVLRKGFDLINHGKEEEALAFINDFEKKEDLKPTDIHWYKVLKGTLLLHIGRLPESLKISENGYKESISQNEILYAIDFFFVKWCINLIFNRAPELWNELTNCEKLLKTVGKEPLSEFKLREAFVCYMKGYHLWWEGVIDDALNSAKRALKIYEEYNQFSFLLHTILFLVGTIYTAKGELDLALQAHNESLTHSRGSVMMYEMIDATSYSNIGLLYFQKGDPDYAIENYERSLKIWEKYTFPVANNWVGDNYNRLISVFLYKKSPDIAQEYLDRFQSYLEKRKISINIFWYRLAKAKILRSSSRIRNRAEAEKILKELIKGHDTVVKSGTRGVAEEFTIAIIELCDLYIEELQLTHDLEILDDIEPYIERLLKESERTNSYSQLAHIKLFQGQLALLQINIGDARRFISHAQHIAEEHNLQLLARAISREHDKLLEQLDKWESLEGKKSSIPERMDLASLDITMDRIQGRRAIEPPELVDEEPVLLLILGDDGVPYFNHSFVKGWDDQDLFSGFMSAFNSFSSEFFSKSIDRIKIDENIILFKPVESFMVCYVIKGQSYPALLKLTRFSDAIKWKSEIWEALNKAVKTSEVLELHNPSSLGDVVNEIFK